MLHAYLDPPSSDGSRRCRFRLLSEATYEWMVESRRLRARRWASRRAEIWQLCQVLRSKVEFMGRDELRIAKVWAEWWLRGGGTVAKKKKGKKKVAKKKKKARYGRY